MGNSLKVSLPRLAKMPQNMTGQAMYVDTHVLLVRAAALRPALVRFAHSLSPLRSLLKTS
jgi:hypothetical protein